MAAMHASERLYVDAAVRSERMNAHKSAFLAEEKRRWSAEGAKARKHSRATTKSKSPANRRKLCLVARALDLDKFSDAFCDEAAQTAREESMDVEPEVRRPKPKAEVPLRRRRKTETDIWRDCVITNRNDFDAWAAHQRRRFLYLLDQKGDVRRPRAPVSPEKPRHELERLEENWI